MDLEFSALAHQFQIRSIPRSHQASIIKAGHGLRSSIYARSTRARMIRKGLRGGVGATAK